jgi:phosphatidate cytidylyltransferase
MLRQRIIFGAVMITALLGIAWLDDWLSQQVAEDWTPRLLINIGLSVHEGLTVTTLVAVLALLAVREMGRLLRAAGYAPATVWAAVAAVVLVFIPWFVRNGITDEVSADVSTDYAHTMRWLAFSMVIAFLAVCRRRRTAGAAAAVATTMLVIIYGGLLAGYAVRLRMWSSAWLLLYVLLVIKVCDIGAYFTGLRFGRHKLIAWLSPGKTWEGLAGGMVASVVVAVVVTHLVRTAGPPRIAPTFPKLEDAAWFGLAMALFGQAGDLFASLLKRDAAAKDSGAAVPAFGGVLDIIDSPLMAVPVAYWMLIRS